MATIDDMCAIGQMLAGTEAFATVMAEAHSGGLEREHGYEYFAFTGESATLDEFVFPNISQDLIREIRDGSTEVYLLIFHEEDPPHYHMQTDFVMIPKSTEWTRAGSWEYMVGDSEWKTAHDRACINVPRGVVHGFRRATKVSRPPLYALSLGNSPAVDGDHHVV